MTKKDDPNMVFVIRDSDKVLRENVNRTLRNAHIMLPDEFYMSEELTKAQRAWIVDRMAQRDAAHHRLQWSEDQVARMAQEIAELDDSEEDRYEHPDVVFSDSAEAVKITDTFEAKVTKAAELEKTAATLEAVAEAIESVTPPAPPPMPPGGVLIRIASALLQKEAYKRYVEPHIADIQYEFAEEMAKGRKLRAYYRVVLGHLLWIVPLGFALWKKLSPLWAFASK
jgi:hypothetical protein